MLVITMVFSLAACGGDTKKDDAKKDTTSTDVAEDSKAPTELKPEEGAVLKVWESPGPEKDFVEMVAKEFTEKYGVEVIYEEVGHADAKGRLAQDGPAGVGADVFAAPHDHTGELAAAGLIYPNSFTEERVKNEFMKAASDAVTYEGTLYGYPLGIETYGLFYNKDIFKEAPKTYQEIIDFGKTYNNPKENKYAMLWDVSNAYFSHSFVAGMGGYVFGENGFDKNDLGLNSEEGVKGVEEMLKLKEIIPLKAGDSNYDAMNGLFQEGKVGAIINGPWAVQGMVESGLNFGIAPLPTLSNGNNPVSFSGTRTFFVSSYTKYPQAAQLFAQFATSDEMLLKRFEITKQIPPVTALMEAKEIAENELVVPFLQQAQHAVPMPSIPEMGTVWDPYKAGFTSAWDGDMTAKEAMDNAVDTIKGAIEAQQQ